MILSRKERKVRKEMENVGEPGTLVPGFRTA